MILMWLLVKIGLKMTQFMAIIMPAECGRWPNFEPIIGHFGPIFEVVLCSGYHGYHVKNCKNFKGFYDLKYTF